ncbi:multimeric flavodoxin WrbA [Bradyrhizobium sp. S3.2.12]
MDWLAARDAILEAQRRHDDADATPRIFIVNGAARSEHTCPGEMSKTWRMVKLAAAVLVAMGYAVDILDLSRLTSEFGKTIYPCKSCVSTAMPLCHWPCSCYPNYALGQTGDWMNEIYPLWVAAHGILIVTPVNWYHVPGGLKAMMDRLVCAEGGNPDPTSTHGKKADEAKAIELKGWPYPRHLAGRHFGLVVHGDSVGAESVRRTLSDWLTDMHLISAGPFWRARRLVGYMESYATSHRDLDEDGEFRQEVRNVVRALGNAVRLARSGRLDQPGAGLQDPNPK